MESHQNVWGKEVFKKIILIFMRRRDWRGQEQNGNISMEANATVQGTGDGGLDQVGIMKLNEWISRDI